MHSTTDAWRCEQRDHAIALARGLDVSCTEIGASLGVTRQVAQQRFSLAPTD